jgi:hypothetical protein
MREKLPDDREGTTIHFTIETEKQGTVDGYLQLGHYVDGRLGEIFVKIANLPDVDAGLQAWALLFSLALQHGVPVGALCKKFIGWHGEPSGRVSPGELVVDADQNMPMCKSAMDLVCRVLRKRYARFAIEVEEAEGVS